MWLSQFPLTFFQNQSGVLFFIKELLTILMVIGMVFVILRDVSWGDIFIVGAFKYCEWFQVGTDVYIPHSKCQIKPFSPPWF